MGLRDDVERIENKLDRIFDALNESSVKLVRQHHDLYGNGKKGLFEDFADLKKKVDKNSKYILSGGVITSFIAFLPILKGFIKDLIK